MTAAERVHLWSQELFTELLPLQSEPGVPILLACDDETIRVVAERLGCGAQDPGKAFASDVAVAFSVGKNAGWKNVVAGNWEKALRPRPLPPFFSVLCLWVLAATRMAPYGGHRTTEYHDRLCRGLLGIDFEDKLPCFEFVGPRFLDLATWLAHDLAGQHGRLIVPADPWPRYVGYAVAQTVFRLRDRQVLSTFFAERLQGSLDGFDPLRRLQRWSGRFGLTRHALELVEGDEFADRVRAAIRAAFRSWDGTELVETESGVGRLWPALLRLVIYPKPHLQFGARNQKPLELSLDGASQTLAPGRELELPWGLVGSASSRPVDLGDPSSPSGGVRLPRLGETLIFENGEDGLLRVEQPAAEGVWVLSGDSVLQERLRQRKFGDGGSLPVGWQLFFEVPVEELPGVERAPFERPQQMPLRIEGGLPLGRPRYLSGYPPCLVAGDLETDEELRVLVNGRELGRISSGGRLRLPAEPGRHDLEVGDGDFKWSYDIEERGEPQPARLCHQLGSERALRTGARPARAETNGVLVCGATVHPPYAGLVPLLTRVPCDVETISADGALSAHARPPTPAWFREVGLDERSRWELFCQEQPVWLVLPPTGGSPRVRLLADVELTWLDEPAVRRVLALGTDVDLLRGALEPTDSASRWRATVELAQALASGEVRA
jgi:hypothetical protein